MGQPESEIYPENVEEAIEREKRIRKEILDETLARPHVDLKKELDEIAKPDQQEEPEKHQKAA
ncbi:MAG: hypothetical protein A2660_02645 [Candidatus Doudnabacteria bacterium RIFCSPHIGHO2_01_FULL_45_18]|uniref:Uncharacterized protein n=1 Tax=Candidatus Doudnabacteria bacterium RIFCSPHIGHO2_01_FULL_45_18 TaxID=1817823 RepID=A0A1F5NQL1_9BACT|nr:MAG: hypothetical protein A2660_02645 [Candidatus Doudnabacteria bacterium RIFCSPHIGHO2_01_FULL_45_18]